ncbi:MAG: hypothetical protein LBQ69_05275 [Treponema sp.]|jgi:hypothetical protein|nr:hypothetical protein [Treponema sp.]
MEKTRLTLNDHLFEALEYVGDRSITGDDLKEEISRAEAKCTIAQQIIAGGNLLLNATKAADAFNSEKTKVPTALQKLLE